MRILVLSIAVATTTLLVAGCTRWTLRPQPELAGGISETIQGDRRATAQVPSGSSATSVAGVDGKVDGEADAENPLDLADKEITEDLENLEPVLAIARLSERHGDTMQARRLYKIFLERHPEHPLPYHRLGVMAARETRYDEAERQFLKAMQVAPPSAALLSDLGYMYYLQDRLDEAENYLQKALEMEPGNAMASNNLALIFGARGQFDRSLKFFRRCNKEAESHANLAFILAQHGRLGQAREEYLHALTLDNSLRNAAEALLQIQERAKAAQVAMQRHQQPARPEEKVNEMGLALGGRPSPGTHPAGRSAPGVARVAPQRRPMPTPTPQERAPNDTSTTAQLAGMLMPVPARANTAPPQLDVQNSPTSPPQRREFPEAVALTGETSAAAPDRSIESNIQDSPPAVSRRATHVKIADFTPTFGDPGQQEPSSIASVDASASQYPVRRALADDSIGPVQQAAAAQQAAQSTKNSGGVSVELNDSGVQFQTPEKSSDESLFEAFQSVPAKLRPEGVELSPLKPSE